jgi:hypothetical protein
MTAYVRSPLLPYTRRDYFATQALQVVAVILSASGHNLSDGEQENAPRTVAKLAFEIADEMLRESEKTSRIL